MNRRNKHYGDNSNGNDDNYAEVVKTDQKALYCINCWRSMPATKFFTKDEGFAWQYTVRCELCERKYQQDFMEKHPNTKRRYNLDFLTVEEEVLYKQIMDERRFKNE